MFSNIVFQDFKFRAVLRTLCGHTMLDRVSHEESVRDIEGEGNKIKYTLLLYSGLGE